MSTGPETLVRYIRRLAIRREPNAATDAALLGRFLSDHDERAFAALVDRHGPLVLNVCQRVLGDVDDAEDAFQATFLVLAHKAGSVRPREALAAWLHGVARRVALKARSSRVRQFRQARPLSLSASGFGGSSPRAGVTSTSTARAKPGNHRGDGLVASAAATRSSIP